jgi:ADP-dependent NAD(P)H-hydrate dehydratase / NAD(P)H-hydrate epimerase
MDMHGYWRKQEQGKPLYPDLLWNRPENKLHAGKLLIVGGNKYGFQAPALAAGEAAKAGVGVTRTVLPDALQKTVSKLFPDVEYAPSTPSGSFARESLGEVINAALWADGVLCAGDFGRNSETAIMLETLLQKYTGLLVLTQDAADYFVDSPQALLARQNTTLVISFGQLQKIASHARPAIVFAHSMDFVRIVETLHDFTTHHPISVVTKHQDTIFIATGGNVVSHKLTQDQAIWRVKTATHAAVWQLQNPSKALEALASSLI